VGEEVPMDAGLSHTAAISRLRRLNPYNTMAAAAFAVALFHFTFCLLWALGQPILDLWGFRPAQTAISVPFIMSGRGLFASIVPIFGEPWRLPQEFPFYQWCVALFALVTRIPADASGRIVSGLFAIGTLWPVYLLAKEFVPTSARRPTFMLGSLWLFSPIVVFWGRSFLIETTAVFLSATWLAFYVRFLGRSRWQDYIPCLIFGILGGVVKIPAFAAFAVAGFLYTCWWGRRKQLAAVWPTFALAGVSVLAVAAAFLGWSRLVDHYMASNPLAALLRFASMPTRYIGNLNDRWSADLWSFALQSRDLPDGLGAAWLAVICLSVLLAIWGKTFWAVIGLLVSFLSTYLFFPLLHIDNPYYLVEGVLLLLAAVIVAAESLVERRAIPEALLGWGLFALAFGGEIWTTYNGTYGPHLFADLHNHPYYKAARVVAAKTTPSSVVVVFGTGWGADIPFYATRRGIVLANFFPPPLINQVLLEDPGRWLSGRKVGAIVDCTVFSNQETTVELAAIRDKLIATTGATPEWVDGSVAGSTSSSPGCTVAVPKS